MEQVDKQKFINELEERKKFYNSQATKNYVEKEYEIAARFDSKFRLVKELITELESGTFDIQEVQPPKLSVGDKVYHTKLKYQGTIKSISKSGKTVRITRDGERWADGNVSIDNIRLIQEVTDDQ